MRENQKVCIEVDDCKTHDLWHSVIVFGHYEELPDLPGYEGARLNAYRVLGSRVMWWEPAAVSVTHRDTGHSLIPIFFRIRIERMTGHRASPDPIHSEKQERPHSPAHHWWSHISHR
jgi:nitroimidazol reductase NimA-like FMN-containing flavoprotein (pyridoxamine 5'-phosphate oxidase superfamily)